MSLDKYRSKSSRRGDMTIILLALGLSLFGLLMISSASVVISYDQFGSNTVYLGRQALYFAIGFSTLIATSLIDYHFWKKYALGLLLITLLLLVAVHIPGIGPRVNGARRWIDLGPFLLQPSELLKAFIIVYLAAWFEKKGPEIRSLTKAIMPFSALMGVIIILIMNQPDLGTALVVVAISTIMLLVAGASLTHIFAGLSLGSGLIFILIKSADYRWQRFLTFLHPSADLQGSGYQINQALIAIGSGSWLGKGFGQSIQKYLYLPLAQTDAIFAIIVEELGFVRVLIILIAFVYLSLKGYQIASSSPDKFGQLLATGITTWIIFQALVNIGGIMGLIPLTGIPLPFISYGGSSLLALLGSTGVLYNISRQTIGGGK